MACNWTWFTTYHSLSPQSPVTLGDNSSMEATGIGTVTLCTWVGGATNEFILSNVLFVPDFQITLISVNKLAKAGLSTFFPRNTSTCSIHQGKTLVVTRWHQASLYHANTTLVLPKEAANMFININTLHQCIGHISMDQICHMVKEDQLQGIQHLTGKLEFCKPCTITKMKKLPFKPAKEAWTTWPLQMVHTDVGGPITPASREGYKYWMVIIDDFTCFPWVYFMKHKSEAPNVYK